VPTSRPVDEPNEDRGSDVSRLRDENARLRRDLERVERERDRLKRENERLKSELEAARRAGTRQASPFAKRRRQGTGRPPGRRAGARYGRRGRRRPPARIDETYDATLPDTCPHCGDHLRETHITDQYQEELPPVQPIVRHFRIHIGCCRGCRRRVQGQHPLQNSSAVGAAAVHLGPQALALAVVLHKLYGVPLGKVATLFRDVFGLTITRGGLVHIVQRAARRAQPSYEALCAQVRGSPVVTADETGWKVDRVLHWLWAFVTPETTVYAIRPGRGYEDAVTILGPDFAGVLVRDGWAPYRRFAQACHQTCLQHLLHRCEILATDHPQSAFAPRVQAVLHDALALRDRARVGEVSTHGVAVARGHLWSRLEALVNGPVRGADQLRFAAHLVREAPALFTFLYDDRVDATNWRAEHAIRPAVVQRKICGGSRSDQGREAHEVLLSVLRTSQQRGVDPRLTLASLLKTSDPHVPFAFTHAT
jgi:transposase